MLAELQIFCFTDSFAAAVARWLKWLLLWCGVAPYKDFIRGIVQNSGVCVCIESWRNALVRARGFHVHFQCTSQPHLYSPLGKRAAVYIFSLSWKNRIDRDTCAQRSYTSHAAAEDSWPRCWQLVLFEQLRSKRNMLLQTDSMHSKRCNNRVRVATPIMIDQS